MAFKPKSVRTSKTNIGRGVFAKQLIRRNSFVDKIKGQIIEDADYSSEYSIEIDESSVLEPITPFRFLNHNCDPNCQIVAEEDSPILWLEAIKTIHYGEQLTIDYAWSAEAAIECLCRSPKCRGWIVDLKELPLSGGAYSLIG